MALCGGIEAGGTKFVCAVGTGPGGCAGGSAFPDGLARGVYPPLDSVLSGDAADPWPVGGRGHCLFRSGGSEARLTHLWLYYDHAETGLGPHGSGRPAWRALNVPIGFDTDVNGAALAEFRWGAAQGLDTFVYITVGTGIGGGAMVNGRLVHGLMHPEMGHVLPPHDRTEDPFPGACPYHGDCLEGLASGPAMEQRWKEKAENLGPDHPAWDLEAKYLAHGIVPQIYIVSPQRIIMGGGVMDQAHLFSKVRRQVQAILHGYIQAPAILEDIDNYIVPPGLGNRAGVLGAIALAQSVAGLDGSGR